MNTLKAILAAVAIFAAGLVIGVLSPRLLGKPSPSTAPGVYPPSLGPNQRAEYLRKLENRLNLTADQKEKAERILRESQERVKTLWDSVSPEMRRELETTREKIQALLSPEQKAKFQEMRKSHLGPKFEEGRMPRWDRRRESGAAAKEGEAQTNPPANPLPAEEPATTGR